MKRNGCIGGMPCSVEEGRIKRNSRLRVGRLKNKNHQPRETPFCRDNGGNQKPEGKGIYRIGKEKRRRKEKLRQRQKCGVQESKGILGYEWADYKIAAG